MWLTFGGYKGVPCHWPGALRLLLLLLLCGALMPQLVAAEMYEGDECKMKSGSGVCTPVSKCTAMENAISRGELTANDVLSCGFGIYEELICCPTDASPVTFGESTTVATSTSRDFWLDLLTTSTTSTTSAPTTTTAAQPDFWLHLLTSSTTTTTPKPLVIGDKEYGTETVYFDFSKLLANQSANIVDNSVIDNAKPPQTRPPNQSGVNEPNWGANRPTSNQVGFRPNQQNAPGFPNVGPNAPGNNAPTGNWNNRRPNSLPGNPPSNTNNWDQPRNNHGDTHGNSGVVWPNQVFNPKNELFGNNNNGRPPFIGNSGRPLQWVVNNDVREPQPPSPSIFPHDDFRGNQLKEPQSNNQPATDANRWNNGGQTHAALARPPQSAPNTAANNNLWGFPHKPVGGSLRNGPWAPDNQRPAAQDPISRIHEHLANTGMNIVKAKLDKLERIKQVWKHPADPAPPTTPSGNSHRVNPFEPFQFRPQPADYEDNELTGSGTNEGHNAFETAVEPSTKPPPTPTPAVTPKTPVRANGRPAVQACVEIDEGLGASLSPHIIGGTAVDIGEFPHMAAIGFTTISGGPNQYDFRCGGTLIERRFVLTAAHCVNSRESQPAIVRLGVTNFTDPIQMRSAVEIKIKASHIHPNYTNSRKYDDVAILELESDVEYSTNVYPTCLYTDPEDPTEKASLYVTGWGVINTKTRQLSDILLKAKLEVVPLDSCNDSYIETGLTRQLYQGIIDTQLCAHDVQEVKDACQGDSGGPLNIVIDESYKKYRVLGIVSVGFSCASNTPGLYTRVSAYLDYIESIVWPQAKS